MVANTDNIRQAKTITNLELVLKVQVVGCLEEVVRIVRVYEKRIGNYNQLLL